MPYNFFLVTRHSREMTGVLALEISHGIMGQRELVGFKIPTVCFHFAERGPSKAEKVFHLKTVPQGTMLYYMSFLAKSYISVATTVKFLLEVELIKNSQKKNPA